LPPSCRRICLSQSWRSQRANGGRTAPFRPAVEDLWGAGGFLAALADHGVGSLSPEARAAAAAYRETADDLPALLKECAGGRELIGYGFAEDVAIAAELDASESVPVLGELAFRSASSA
jgi:2-phosphosulfolactate phosphatase